jgi:hypothetical protein
MVRTLKKILPLILFASCIVVNQEKQQPPSAKPEDNKQEQRDLPKIDLPEFNITGNELVNLPPFQKQILDTEEFYTAQEPQVKDFGAREQRNDPYEVRNKPIYPENHEYQFKSKILAGYGFYNTPNVQAWFGNWRDDFEIISHANYVSRGDYVEYANLHKADGAISTRWRLPDNIDILSSASLNSRFGVFGSNYYFYGSPTPNFKRYLRGFDADIQLLKFNNSWETLNKNDLPFNYSAKLNWNNLTIDDSSKITENQIGFGIELTRSFGAIIGKVSFDYTLNAISKTVSVNNPYYTKVSIGAQIFISQMAKMDATIDAYVVRSTENGATGKLYPTLGFDIYPTHELTLFARLTPCIQQMSYSKLLELNPYMRTESVFHTDKLIELNLGGMWEPQKDLRTQVVLGFQKVKNYPIFIDNPAAGIWSPVFNNQTTSIFSITAEGYYEIGIKDLISGKIILNKSSNTFNSDEVPYVPNLIINGIAQHRLDSKLLLEIEVSLIGSRNNISYDGHFKTRKITSFLDVNAKGEYRFTKYFTTFMKVQNIFNQKYAYFNNYREMPLTLTLGFTVQW